MLLSIDGLTSGYGELIALRSIDISVETGQIVTVVGRNGAGKSTLVRTISGVQPLKAGTIVLDGVDISRTRPSERVRRGIAHVPEGRQIFSGLSVTDNLVVGGYTAAKGAGERIEAVFERFPILRDKRHQDAGTLSGGQQQMLAVGRAMMMKPRLLMLDEPSMGLAPKIAQEILRTIVELRATGTTILLIEQNARAALSIADYAYVLERGRVVASGAGRSLLADAALASAYIGKH